jgi:hypothetical protein
MNPPCRLEPTTHVNTAWTQAERGGRITVKREALLDLSMPVFAMGSCFAVEVRRALRAAGFTVGPSYADLAFDPAAQAPGNLPQRDNINHYDTFTIRQEIERALQRERWSPETFWERTRDPLLRRRGWATAWQDPFRRRVFAESRDALIELSDLLSDRIDDALAASHLVILTLGLTECWRDRQSGLYACLGPQDEEDEIFDRLEFHSTGFQQNYDNLRAIGDAIWARYPDKRIVLTVSPVALGRTWTGEDVVAATTYSKATLRSVAGQLAREDRRFLYWPAYEYARSHDVFEADGRHVRPDAVNAIVSAFTEAYVA